jgi:hypothetical protein
MCHVSKIVSIYTLCVFVAFEVLLHAQLAPFLSNRVSSTSGWS